jgi:hypothetical protein
MRAQAMPAPVRLAHELAPSLAGLDWAIGGSSLLWRLGIEPAPNDLDLVTTPAHFEPLCAALARRLGPGEHPPHEHYLSAHFLRFGTAATAVVDVMAGIRVRRGTELPVWQFEPRRTQHIDGLPWMPPSDWLTLYALFERPARVAQLQAYLSTLITPARDTPSA